LEIQTIDNQLSLITGEVADTLSRFQKDVLEGLSKSPKSIPPVYFYDDDGSALFEEICGCEEYYLTRCEQEILDFAAEVIAKQLPEHRKLIELGSGSSTKTRTLIKAFLADCRDLEYCPIDISRNILVESAKALKSDFPVLNITAVANHYDSALRSLSGTFHTPTLILWLGSSVGNMLHEEAVGFLGSLRQHLSPDDRLLIGIDMKKDESVLTRAYNDEAGITAAFNLNLLSRINRDLTADFNLNNFNHVAKYSEAAGRIEMYLESSRKQSVRLENHGQVFQFSKGERLLTEYSHKYSDLEVEHLAAMAGFEQEEQWFDSKNYFSLNLWQPKR